MHRRDAGTCWHLETNPIKCTYLPYTYTITVALIYNVCERRVYTISVFSLWRLGGAPAHKTHVLQWRPTTRSCLQGVQITFSFLAGAHNQP